MNRIVIADDHPLFLDALSNAFTNEISNLHIQKTQSYLELFTLLEQGGGDIDLILMDLKMPGGRNETGISYIHSRYPEIPIIILSAHDDFDTRIVCLESGACEFLSKSISSEELSKIIQEMLTGFYSYPPRGSFQESNDRLKKISKLTPTQYKVLDLTATGRGNKEIANALNITEKTVKNHLTAIFEKLDVKNRTQASNIFNLSE